MKICCAPLPLGTVIVISTPLTRYYREEDRVLGSKSKRVWSGLVLGATLRALGDESVTFIAGRLRSVIWNSL